MKKKVFLTILVGGLLFVTTACGGKKDEINQYLILKKESLMKLL